jgi:flavin reductase (DIM6/NTAB) family NADH-FMN oxidoreductase RutF
MISIGKKPTGENKDTVTNLIERKQCVIHIAHTEQASSVNETSRTLAHGESELEYVDLGLAEFEGFDLPRIKECRVAYACDLYDIQEVGNAPQSLVFAQIRSVFVNDEIVGKDAKGRAKIEADKLNPLARLGGSEFVENGRIFSVPRPK